MDQKNLLNLNDYILLIKRMCKDFYHDDVFSEECLDYVLRKLEENDSARLRQYSGNRSAKGFVMAVVKNLIIDFDRHIFGKREIPKVVKDMGKLAMETYRLICFEGFALWAAYYLVSIRKLFHGTEEEFIEQMDPVSQAPCRSRPTYFSIEAEDHPLELAGPEGQDSLTLVLDKEEKEIGRKTLEITHETLEGFPEKDRLMFRLYYGDDVSYAKIARSFGLSRSTVKKRLDWLMNAIRKNLKAAGIQI